MGDLFLVVKETFGRQAELSPFCASIERWDGESVLPAEWVVGGGGFLEDQKRKQHSCAAVTSIFLTQRPNLTFFKINKL